MGAVVAFQQPQALEEVLCGECGISFAMPAHLLQRRRDDGERFYCPNGHCRAFRETTVARLQRELDAERQSVMMEQHRAEMAERAAATARAETVRLQKRVSAGVCPHCQRTVRQLVQHIQSKHPDCVNRSTPRLPADVKRTRVRRRQVDEARRDG